MRNILGCALLVSSLAFTGCAEYRGNMMTAQDRAGHAAGEPGGLGTGDLAQKRPAGKGEMYITLAAQDTLASVAKAYGVTLDWLIKRNDLRTPTKAGDNLIVPNQAK